MTAPKVAKVERKLFVSEVYKRDDEKLWRMLVTLLTQMHDTTTSEDPTTPYQYVAEVGPNIEGFQWKSISPGVSLSSMNFLSIPAPQTKSFYVWENLGHGVSGRAFLVSSKALDRPPIVGVIKCFFSQTKDKDMKQAAREEARNAEATCWEKVYPNYGHRKVEVFKGRPALLMQFFASIDDSERKEMVSKVRETLEHNYNKKGLVHEDVQWRNIGRDYEGRAVVYDMGRVKEKKKGDEGWVEKAINKLGPSC